MASTLKGCPPAQQKMDEPHLVSIVADGDASLSSNYACSLIRRLNRLTAISLRICCQW